MALLNILMSCFNVHFTFGYCPAQKGSGTLGGGGGLYNLVNIIFYSNSFIYSISFLVLGNKYGYS